ncbi:MAG: hypothetical protein E6G60_07980 [Actinobacteria bacterium]|nr:MAG: hypothetical protein E6G60_07980 [Actinomycetota bacterium]
MDGAGSGDHADREDPDLHRRRPRRGGATALRGAPRPRHRARVRKRGSRRVRDGGVGAESASAGAR